MTHYPALPAQTTPPAYPFAPGEAFWVFGYGSLMWNPGFHWLEKWPARLIGYHRKFCVTSHIHRGTSEKPGLVLGLDRGGSCLGMVFKVAPAHGKQAFDYLWAREMCTAVYQPRFVKTLPHNLSSLEPITALTFVVDRQHSQYCPGLDVHDAAELIRHAYGKSGPNTEYLLDTVTHLRELGIVDRQLEALAKFVESKK